jgi:transposase
MALRDIFLYPDAMSKRTDLRRLTHKELTQFRRQAVSQIQSGQPPHEVAKVMGVSRSALFGWLSLYRSGGWNALNAGKRGGRKAKLDGEGISWVYKTVTGNNPKQINLPFALWTANLVAKAIATQFGIKLSRWSVARLLRQLGLSPQKPLFRAYQQNPDLVDQWKRDVYPSIQKKAKREGAMVFFLDESAVRSDHHSGTTWAPVGKTPVVQTTGARFSLNIIGAITPRGVFRFMTYKGSMNAALFIDFLKRLIDGNDRRIHLIVDGHPVHRSKAVKTFVEEQAEHIELHLLPSYSPELNPIEQVWNHAKNHQIGKQVITGPDQLKSMALSALRRLQKMPAIIRGFFHHPECSYAAD